VSKQGTEHDAYLQRFGGSRSQYLLLVLRNGSVVADCRVLVPHAGVRRHGVVTEMLLDDAGTHIQHRPDQKREPFRLDATKLECESC
jgi:hypothetical protein